MRVDYLIVGQGLAGTWLSYYLMKGGARVVVLDAEAELKPASLAASGLINPITGKRLARQPMADQLLPFAAEAYSEMSAVLGIPLAQEIPIHTFFDSPDEAVFFEKKAAEPGHEWLHYNSRIEAAPLFESSFGTGTVYPAQLINLQRFLPGWREVLKARQALFETRLDWQECRFAGGQVHYREWEATAILDCSGAAGIFNPFFQNLPFARNKGEVLLARIPGLPRAAVYRHSHLAIVPFAEDRFWIGSTFDWDFQDALPTQAFRQKAENILRRWLRLPVQVEAHFAALRPATVTRDAFAGLHPELPVLGILNGLGSKGCALAPFLAQQFAQHLLSGTPLLKQASLERYARVLQRPH